MLDQLQCRGRNSFSHLCSEVLGKLSMGHKVNVEDWLHFLINVSTAVAGHEKTLNLASITIRKIDLVV